MGEGGVKKSATHADVFMDCPFQVFLGNFENLQCYCYSEGGK